LEAQLVVAEDMVLTTRAQLVTVDARVAGQFPIDNIFSGTTPISS